MDQSPQFEHKILEADMQKLAAEVLRHKENPEFRSLGDKELLKKSIQSLVPAPVPQADDKSPSSSPLPAYAQKAPAETKLEIEYLLDLAFHQGIEKANKEAQKSSPFVLDAFHDVLTGKLYSEFQRRGLLK